MPMKTYVNFMEEKISKFNFVFLHFCSKDEFKNKRNNKPSVESILYSQIKHLM